MPSPVIPRLCEKLKKASEQPAVQEKFRAQGFAASWTPPQQAASYLRNEVDKWSRTVVQAGAKVE